MEREEKERRKNYRATEGKIRVILFFLKKAKGKIKDM
jgi:hypothetical protein